MINSYNIEIQKIVDKKQIEEALHQLGKDLLAVKL